VTGGTGALGRAVVEALLRGGAEVHVPYLHAAEGERFPLRTEPCTPNRSISRARRGSGGSMLGVPTLWSSIHLAGGCDGRHRRCRPRG
jgi:NAD(P)-dependent dehydrogenase (short-subunit alcohol dehydrogenase family)